ncbi:MAG: AEC family transporter [Aggregatilineales bacterium]
MTELLGIMFNVIAPIFLVVGAGVAIGRRFKPDPRAISALLIYLFVPALAFDGIAYSDLTGAELLGIAGVATGIALLMALIGLGVSRALRFERRLESAFLISVIMMNAANYGIPLNRFAFGPQGEQRAVIYYVMSVVLGAVLGIFFASRGTASVRVALLNVLRIPISHAALAGLIVNLAGWQLPLPLERGISIMAQGAVPGMLALLGLQLAHSTALRGHWAPIALASGMRLALAPLLAAPLALALGLTGTTFQVAVVSSSMPTAVMANALATQFGSDAEFTAAATLVSTLASVLTLSVLLALLMN